MLFLQLIEMNGSLPLILPVSYVLQEHVKPLYTLSPDLAWGLYMPTNPPPPAFLTAHTHLPSASFHLHNSFRLIRGEKYHKGNKMTAFVYLRETPGSRCNIKIVTAKADSASQSTNYITSSTTAQQPEQQLPTKCSQSKQTSN